MLNPFPALFKFATTKPEAFSRFATVTGFAVSSLGQAWGLSINKEIPTKERKFMVGQELAEGVINIVILFTVSSLFAKFGKGLVNNNIIFRKNNPLNSIEKDALAEGFGLATSLTGQALALNVFTPIMRNMLSPKLEPILRKFIGGDSTPGSTHKTKIKEASPTMLPALPINDRRLDVVIGDRTKAKFAFKEYIMQSRQISKTPYNYSQVPPFKAKSLTNIKQNTRINPYNFSLMI